MKVDYNPYEGRQVTGATDTVLSRGRVVIENGAFVGRAGAGVVPQTRDAQHESGCGSNICAPGAEAVLVGAAIASFCRKASAPPRCTSTAAIIERIDAFDGDRPDRAPDVRRRAIWWSRRASSTRTCTSTSRGAPSGKGSTRRRARRRPAASRRIVDMPLNSVPATTTRRRRSRRSARRRDGQCHVDVGFWGGVVPGNAGELEALVDAGVRGFKCFLVPSGVDEFPAVDEAGSARRRCRFWRAAACRCSCTPSSPDRCADCRERQSHEHYRSTWPRGRSPQGARRDRADDPLARGIQGARPHRAPVVGGGASPTIARAKAAGVPITAETCPHYLTFAADEIPDGATAFKCAPPIREAAHREALWDGLAQRRARSVATRSFAGAAGAEAAAATFTRAWGGIASLELSLAAVWTLGRRRRAARDGAAPGELRRCRSRSSTSRAG